MKALFVDTAGWMACADAADPALEAGQALVTTDFVVDETLTLVRMRLGVAAAGVWWRQIDGSSRLRWERISVERFDRARALFFRRRDKAYSFTHCTSFVVMQELKLKEALTTDRPFRQMGLTVVPRDVGRR